MNNRPLFTHRYAASRAGALDHDTLQALIGELCAARGTPLDATPILDEHVAWATDATAAESARRPALLRASAVRRGARQLLVFTARVEPSLDALRTHEERFGALPLCAAAGYATRCAPPKPLSAKSRARPSMADVRRERERAAANSDRLAPADRERRAVLGAALDGGDALFDRLHTSEPVAVRLLARALDRDPDDTQDDRDAWRTAVVETRSFRLLLIARGYARRRTVMRRAELLPDEQTYLLPADQLGVCSDSDSDDGGAESDEFSFEDDAADWVADSAPEPEAARAAPHVLDALSTLPLDRLCWYECDRSARDRLSVLLSVCAHHEREEHAVELPNARHVRRYPHGPGAPVAATVPDPPGALGEASGEQYAALGCALLAAAVAGDLELERWLLYAEALRALHRTPHAVDEQLAEHVDGVREAIRRARPRDGAGDGARDLLDELRALIRDTANTEFGAEPDT